MKGRVPGYRGSPVVVSGPGAVVLSDVVSPGAPISVVDNLEVGYVVDVSDGVMTNGCVVRSVCSVVTGVVYTVESGWLQSSDIWMTVTTNPMTTTRPATPAAMVAAGVRYHGSLSAATGADPIDKRGRGNFLAGPNS